MTLDLPKLGAPAVRALDGASIGDLATLATYSRSDIAALHGIGPNALGKLDAALSEAGLAWRAREERPFEPRPKPVK